MMPRVHQVVYCRTRFPATATADNTTIHPTHVLGCHLRAHGSLHYEHEDFLARPPYLVVVARGERDRHRLTGPFEGFWCLFDAEEIGSQAGRAIALTGPGARVVRSHVRLLQAHEARAVAARFSELAVQARRPHPSAQLRASALLVELLAWWASPEGVDASEPSPVERFRAAIEHHARDPNLSLAVLARRAGLSASHLGGAFRRAYGMAPVAYRTQLRLAIARELLLTRTLPVAAIAREAGFSDAGYFARVFRRAQGMTPLRFVREHALLRRGSAALPA